MHIFNHSRLWCFLRKSVSVWACIHVVGGLVYCILFSTCVIHNKRLYLIRIVDQFKSAQKVQRIEIRYIYKKSITF